jgi:thiamine biosynthesis lipoprotein
LATRKTILTLLAATLSVAASGVLVYQYRTSSLSQPSSQSRDTIDIPVEASLQDAHKTQLKEFSYSQLQMAMQMRITVWCDSQDHAEEACKLAFDRAAELVKVFSDYDPKSESGRLARSEVGQPIEVSDHLFHVLAFSKILNDESNGAFDPTASPVIRLWRIARKNRTLPESNAIEKALEHVGFDKLQLDLDEKTVTLMASEMDFDFGGIAKGYIGDQAIRVLQENGIEIGCYEAGGDIVLSDPPPGTTGWIIDVGQNNDGTVKTIKLANCGVSTSGDSRQFVEFNGKRFSHVIDPRTGIGVTTSRTAFVIAPTGMESDALATVGCVLNETDFQQLLDRYDDTVGWSERQTVKLTTE